MAIVRLIYFSDFCIELDSGTMSQQLSDILDASERNNAANGVTGALVFDSKWFVQVLEGKLDDVWSTYKKIERDPRHANVSFVEMVTVPSRRFGDWRMGCAESLAKHDAVFAPYLYGGRFVPANMAGDTILSMMMDLSSGYFARPSISAPVPARSAP